MAFTYSTRASVRTQRLVLAFVALTLLFVLPSVTSEAQGARTAVRNSCLADNGRIDVDLDNEEATAQTYFIAVSGLAPRQRTIAAGDTRTLSITGRADGVYQVLVERDGGEKLVVKEVVVACDPAHPAVDLSAMCIGGSGRIDVTVRNTSPAAQDYTIATTGLSTRVRTITAGGVEVVPYTGRPDRRYTVTVNSPSGRVFRQAVHVGCDEPVVDAAKIAVDCLLGRGRVVVTISNDAAAKHTFTVDFGELSSRRIDIPTDAIGKIIITGRSDGTYPVIVKNESTGQVLRSATVQVLCDSPAPPTPTPIPQPTPIPTVVAPAPGPTPLPVQPPRPNPSARIAAIGDYGGGFNSSELEVSQLVDRLDPDFIVTMGDNVYSAEIEDPWSVIDRKIGQYYHEYMFPYDGSYGQGSPTGTNRFFPALGNHDWGDPGTALLTCPDFSEPCFGAWLDFFHLPGNERYYVVEGDVIDVFVIDDYYLEPDGHTPDSDQAMWLKNELASSDASWKIVVSHYPPYLNGSGGQHTVRWPFREWGADALLSGHVHSYERQQKDGMTYIINGVGGINLQNSPAPTPWTRTQYNAQFGAVLIEASEDQLTMELINIDNQLVDWTVEYRVKQGETLEALAERYGVSVSAIRELNPDVNVGDLSAGDTITIARQ